MVNGRTHYLGKLAGQDVVLLGVSGYSMVNVAMTTLAADNSAAVVIEYLKALPAR